MITVAEGQLLADLRNDVALIERLVRVRYLTLRGSC